MLCPMPFPRRTARSFPRIPALLRALCALSIALPAGLRAQVANPDLSALGQVLAGYTDDDASPVAGDPTLRLGEAELILEANLNPFLKGAFTLSAEEEEGVGLEEAYASLIRGLPWGLAMKAGKYRLGFGKVNPAHPHAYPFIDAPRSLVSLLPGGEEGFNETGVQVSVLLPTPGDWASTLSADVIEGRQFHPEGDFTRLGWLGRWANAFLLGQAGALETGLSAASGKVVSPEWDPAYLFGADVKAKFYLSAASQLTVQAEGVYRRFQVVPATEEPGAPDMAGSIQDHRSGFLTFAEYRYRARYSAGALFERWEREPDSSGIASGLTDHAFRVFAGYAVMEESTLLRLAYERFVPEGQAAVNTVTLQLLFRMGPHKPHQF